MVKKRKRVKIICRKAEADEYGTDPQATYTIPLAVGYNCNMFEYTATGQQSKKKPIFLNEVQIHALQNMKGEPLNLARSILHPTDPYPSELDLTLQIWDERDVKKRAKAREIWYDKRKGKRKKYTKAQMERWFQD